MQKTIIYLLLLTILGAGVYFFVVRDRENVFGENEAGFSVKDTSSIGMIYLVRADGNGIKLVRSDSGWILNDSFRARQNTLQNLLTTIHKQTALHPVPENSHNYVIQSLSGNSVKVELYNRAKTKLKTFYVGNETHNFTGSYMLMEGAKKPYVVHVPGQVGYPTPYYTTELKDWRDRTVFKFKEDEIKEVQVVYAEEKLNSFTIKQNDKITVETEPGIAGSNPLNEKRARAYLGFFEEVYCEGYMNGVPDLDSTIASLTKFCSIEVTGKNNRRQHLDIYFMPVNRRSKNLNMEDAGPYDPDRYFGVMNDFKDTVVVQHLSFQRMFVRAWQFFEADKPAGVPGLPANAE